MMQDMLNELNERETEALNAWRYAAWQADLECQAIFKLYEISASDALIARMPEADEARRLLRIAREAWTQYMEARQAA